MRTTAMTLVPSGAFSGCSLGRATRRSPARCSVFARKATPTLAGSIKSSLSGRPQAHKITGGNSASFAAAGEVADELSEAGFGSLERIANATTVAEEITTASRNLVL